jgi:uncharacterized protein YbjT (DUF2867 family)
VDPPILVTGGTGTLGRLVVARLLEAGRDVRVLSRHKGEGEASVEFVAADLATGEGVEAAVAGVEVIVHCAGGRVRDDEKARNLVKAASRAGVRHIIYISVVGAERIPVVSRVDRVMFGYFESKRAAERVVADSGIPWTTLRATQFQQTFLSVARGMAKLPMIPVPSGFQFQPIDAREVAGRLAELALGEPGGLVPEMGGPEVLGMGELIRVYLRAIHRRRAMVSVPSFGGAAGAVRAGGNLTTDPRRGSNDLGGSRWRASGPGGRDESRPDAAPVVDGGIAPDLVAELASGHRANVLHAAKLCAAEQTGLAPDGHEPVDRLVGRHRQSVVVAARGRPEDLLAMLVDEYAELPSVSVPVGRMECSPTISRVLNEVVLVLCAVEIAKTAS